MLEIPDTLTLRAIYAHGLFPMAEERDSDELFFMDPEERALLPIHDIHISRSLKKFMRKTDYTVTVNQDFEAVINACADQYKGRTDTWINKKIQDVFIMAHQDGFAHSIEYRLGGELMGGLYGLSVGGIFCGESMFSRSDNASKVALIHLCARLDIGGYSVLDAQYENEHLKQFGLNIVPKDDYIAILEQYRLLETDFLQEGASEEAILEFYFANRAERAAELKASTQLDPDSEHPQAQL